MMTGDSFHTGVSFLFSSNAYPSTPDVASVAVIETVLSSTFTALITGAVASYLIINFAMSDTDV